MAQEKLQYIEKLLLALTIILIPFVALPQRMIINTIGGEATNYTVLMLFVVFAYEYIKYKPRIKRCFIVFLVIFTLIRIISLIIGLTIFPYYDLITLEQISKLQLLVSKFPILGSGEQLLPYWLFLRESKNIILDGFALFGLPIIMWHLFNNDWKSGFLYLRKAVLILVGVFSVYSIVEILWLKLHLTIAQDILCFINPLFYDPKSAHGWWPPLLWEGQLRSICPEPSYFGIYACFCIPFLWSYLVDKKRMKYIALYTYFILMLFLTKARTALGIYIGEYVLLTISIVINRIRKLFVVLLLVSFSTITSFSLTLVNWESGQEDMTAESYLSNNVASVAETGARSNGARFGNVKAMVNIGIAHIWSGVGKGLISAYMPDYMDTESAKNVEIQLWSNYMREKGILKSGFPTLNQYAGFFAEAGLIGLILFLTPIAYIVYKYAKGKLYKDIYKSIVLIIFAGQLAAMLSNKYFITYPLALGLCLCVVERNYNEVNNEKKDKKYN